ncbi:hypothetical protein [Maridesulfovibrio bastinii]|uniref:hypothetical protein n=1 Tax=Maridesulfovibrio bastinii TaxID=47157 RepID=UPI001FE1115C|nr:hypothetical protein [Maridesulfovibrio bastinii]
MECSKNLSEQGLMIRVSNCLETILELESELKRLDMGKSLVDEFDILKDFLTRMNNLEVCEDDVVRIEAATANFLEELKEPLYSIDIPQTSFIRLQ